MGVPEMTEQRNRIMIFGPKSDGYPYRKPKTADRRPRIG
jgi:hypothetical protein